MEISIAEAHNRLSQLLNQAQKEPITITRHGKPVGILIAPEEYERLRQVQAYLQMIKLSHTLRDRGISAADLYQASRQELEDRA